MSHARLESKRRFDNRRVCITNIKAVRGSEEDLAIRDLLDRAAAKLGTRGHKATILKALENAAKGVQ